MITKEKISNFIWGFVIGDTIGVPYEFQQFSNSRRFEFKGFGTHNQEPGTWSDDTSLMLCQIQCINNGLDIDILKQNLIEWYRDKKFTANNSVFDIGASTRKVIEDLIDKKTIDELEYSNFKGNGTLLRVLVLSLLNNLSKEKEKELIQLTTRNESNIQYCQCFLEFTRLLINEVDKFDSFDIAFKNSPNFINNFYKIGYTRKEINPSGYIVDTINTVLLCFFETSSYRNAITKAINLGGDTDSICAILGAICGVHYNEEIPDKLKSKIVNRKLIEENVISLTKSLIQ